MTGYTIAIAALLVAVAAPALLALRGVLARGRYAAVDGSHASLPWSLTVRSLWLYTLAFNLTFFVQELCLVLPKAFTPGLHPTLFHNNHTWTGTHPLAAAFQGTGALATLLSGMSCWWWLRRLPPASANLRLFLLWMAYCGLLMALPQFAIGALSAGSDVGMAMGYFGLGDGMRLAIGLATLAAIVPVALALLGDVLRLANHSALVDTARARNRFAWRVATLPALGGTLASIAFRVPRDWIEVLVVPAWVACFGITWIQAGAWRQRPDRVGGSLAGSSWFPLLAALALLAIFQLVLRPGIAFYR